MGRTSRQRKRKHCSTLQRDLSHERTYIELLQWMHRSGYRGSSLKPTEFSGTGRGIAAGKTIRKNDVIIAIPRTLLIGVQAALNNSSWVKLITSRVCQLTGMEILCTYLMEEKWKIKQGCTSAYKPYITSLPVEFNHHIFWQPEMIKLLPKSIVPQAIVQHQTVRNQFKSLKTALYNLIPFECYQFFTINEYKWAWCCVNSRCIYSDHESFANDKRVIKSKSSNYYLAPFLDLLNHSPTADVIGSYNYKTQCFEINTLSTIHKHLQVMICYGHHSTCDLFLEYGFVLPFTNPNDIYEGSVDDLIVGTMKSSLLNKREVEHLSSVFSIASISSHWCIDHQGISFSLQSAVLMLAYVEQILLRNQDSSEKFIDALKMYEKNNLKIFVQKILNNDIDNCTRKRAETLLSSFLMSIENSLSLQYKKCLNMLKTEPGEREKLSNVIRLYEIYIELVSKSLTNGLLL